MPVLLAGNSLKVSYGNKRRREGNINIIVPPSQVWE